MNGATEATLSDLLATAQAMNVNMIKLQQLVKSSGSNLGSGSSGAGAAASSVAGVAASLNPLGLAFGILKGAVGAVGSVLGVMGSILGQVVGVASGLVKSLYSLGVATAISGTKVSEFYDAFKGVPIIGGAFSILADIIRYQEQLLEFFQQVAMSGAGFTGSLTQMKNAAAKSYMSMQDFSTVVKENTETFALMGGTVMSSVNKFVDIQNKLLGPRSEYANMMYGMGYTAKTTGDLLAYYMKIQSMTNKDSQQSTSEIIKGTAEYARELNLLSQLTGANNKDLKAKAEEVANQAAYQLYRTTITGSQATTEMGIITELIKTHGKDIADQFRDSYGVNVARTKEQQYMSSLTNGASMDFISQVRDMVKSGRSLTEINDFVRRNAVTMGTSLKPVYESLKNIGPEINDQLKVILPTMQFVQSQKDQTTLTKNVNTSLKNQADAAKGNAAALERAEQAMRNFGAGMLGIASTVLGPFIPLLQAFATGFVSLMNAVVGSGGFKDAVSGVTSWFKETAASIKAAYNKGGFVAAFGELFNKSVDGLTGVWKKVEPVVLPVIKSAFDGIMKFLQPWFEKALDTIFDNISDFIYNKTGIGESTAQRKMRQSMESTASYRMWLEEERKKLGGHGLERLGFTGWSEMSPQDIFQKYQDQRSGKAGGGRGSMVPPVSPEASTRHKGTIGMTGNWWEKSNATLDIQQGESVVTQDQMSQIVGAASQNGLVESIQQLNSLVALQVKYAKETAEYARRNVDATRSLDGNQFARA
jgi:hypothetical protein